MTAPFIFNGLDFDMDIELMLFGPKRCACCGRVLARSSDFFVRDVTADDLWSSHCKECRNGRARERYQEGAA